ncbi:hypothetical protein IW140_003666 [Coemansia sp. RSA 1813]|nr:hypothetical protein LPJ74_002934 [Coemansia sp. RSA 1843]KAJ2213720.1 hypothetical protein EV179_003620 [Coemansia sp. RSA 487]KAJ2568677.1 hypothetical protein IW140_003666 [Coemansia sp. RSA 1813]
MPTDQMTNANKPLSADGKTYHVETKWGQVANRLLTVGDPQRARLISKHLDKVLFEHQSHRGILTITGIYKNLPVSIVAIGMGLSMMDFFVREVRMVVKGPLTIIRLGSCGSICDAQAGDVIVASGAFGISTNYSFYANKDPNGTTAGTDEPYILWPTVQPDRKLTECLSACVAEKVPGGLDHVFEGEVGNADGFYSAQGRIGDDFYDANSGLLDRIRATHPNASALEMECHMLFHLASISTGPNGSAPQSIRAACALVVFADRTGNSFISPDKSAQTYRDISNAILDALAISSPTQTASMHPSEGSVWEGEL